jgi:hypothetical protein
MRDRSANDPRDEAIRAAQHDAAVLAAILEDEFRPAGGSLEVGASGVWAAFDNRRIAIRFGNR